MAQVSVDEFPGKITSALHLYTVIDRCDERNNALLHAGNILQSYLVFALTVIIAAHLRNNSPSQLTVHSKKSARPQYRLK